MHCIKCGKEISNESQFCTYCGTKVENNKNVSKNNEQGKKINILSKLKQILIKNWKKIIIPMIIVLVLILGSSFVILLSNQSKEPVENDSQITTNLVKKTYTKNQIGFFKSDDIIEEKYNEQGDLIYCKYKQGEEIVEDKYSYDYTSDNKVSKITMPDNSYITVEYNEFGIWQITTHNTALNTGTKHVYTSGDENSRIILNYSIDAKGTEKNTGNTIIKKEEFNGQNYILKLDFDTQQSLKEQEIYIESSLDNSSSLRDLFIIPINYFNNDYLYENNNLDNKVSSLVGYKANYWHGLKIKSIKNNDTSIYKYDNMNRILLKESEVNGDSYFKYEKISENEYYKYCITESLEVDNNYKEYTAYYKVKNRYYLDDNGKIEKIEEYEEEIGQQEYEKLKIEYMEYIEKNKVDTNVIFEDISEYTTISTGTTKENKSINDIYKELIKQSSGYSLVDINNDGTKELVLLTGTCNADVKFEFYTYKDGKAIKLGENGYGYSNLYEMNNGNYLKQVYGHGGYQMIFNIYYDGNTFEVKELEERQLTVEEELNNGYDTGDSEITMFESTDLSGLKE